MTKGTALIATGSPFKPVKGPWGSEGKELDIRMRRVQRQRRCRLRDPCRGMLCRTRLVTDKMLIAAVNGVAELSPALKDNAAPVLPGVDVVGPGAGRVGCAESDQAAVKEGPGHARGHPEQRRCAGGMDQGANVGSRAVYWRLKYVEAPSPCCQAKGGLRVVGCL
jgi:malate dehydrogenase (oxaloacetate-decarboxylating)